jgi:hypothetical protein
VILRRNGPRLRQAVANTRAGVCLFSETGEPCARTRRRGLADDHEDTDFVLVCGKHAGWLFKWRRTGDVERLRHALTAQPSRKEERSHA